MSNETCPHCGAEKKVQTENIALFECGTAYLKGYLYERKCECCERQIAQQQSVIETMLDTLLHIRNHGGTTDDESGLSHNGSWCAEQARCALEAVK